MGASLLTLVQRSAAEMNLAVPTQVVGATDQQTVQLLALINAVGNELLTVRTWTMLSTQQIVSVPAALVGTCDTVVGSTTLSNVSSGTIEPESNPSLWVAQGTNIVSYARLISSTPSIPGSAVIDTPATATAVGKSCIISQDTFPFPSDFVALTDDTQWDRGNRWQLYGPLSPQEDQYLRSGIVSLTPRRRYRQVGRSAPGLRVAEGFRLFPPPGQNDTPGPMVYEYLSSYWAQSAVVPIADGYNFTTKEEFTADTDTCIYDDRVMIEGLKYKFFQAKGWDWTGFYSSYQRVLDVSAARDGGVSVVSLNRRKMPYLISSANVQDGFFPGRGTPS